MNAALMHRRHTDPVQLQVVGVRELSRSGSMVAARWVIRETVVPPGETSKCTELK